MALDKAQLKSKLVRLFNKPQKASNVDQVAGDLATAIDEFVKTATVTGATSDGATLVQTQIH